MIPHSENDSTVFEANVLIVHFTLWNSMSGRLHQGRHACSAVFAHLVVKKKALWRMTDLRNPLLEELLLYLSLIGAVVA